MDFVPYGVYSGARSMKYMYLIMNSFFLGISTMKFYQRTGKLFSSM